MRLSLLAIGLLFASTCTYGSNDTLRIHTVQITDAVQSCNLFGFQVVVRVSWRKGLDASQNVVLTLALNSASGAAVAYQKPESMTSFLTQHITLTSVGDNQRDLVFFVPYSQLKLAPGANTLLPIFSLKDKSVTDADAADTGQAASTTLPVLVQPAAAPFSIQQPEVFPLLVELQYLQVRSRDAFGRAWDTVGFEPDIVVNLSCAAEAALVVWHNYPSRKNTSTVSYVGEQAKVYMTAQDRLDFVVYDDDFNGPETVACLTYPCPALQSGTIEVQHMGLIVQMKASITLAKN